MRFDMAFDELNEECKGSSEFKDIRAAVDDFNFELEMEKEDPFEKSLLLELLSDDRTVAFPSESSYSEEPSDLSGEDVLQSFINLFDPPDESHIYATDFENLLPLPEQGRPFSLAEAREGRVREPLLKASLLDEEPLSFHQTSQQTLWSMGRVPTTDLVFTSGGSDLIPSPLFPDSDESMLQLLPLSQGSQIGVAADFSGEKSRKRKGGPNGRSEEELQQLHPSQVKRILSNRASAARSKDRRRQYVESLQERSKSLSCQNQQLKLQIQQIQWILTENVQDVHQAKIQAQSIRQDLSRTLVVNRDLEKQFRAKSPFRPIPSQQTLDEMDFSVDEFLRVPSPL